MPQFSKLKQLDHQRVQVLYVFAKLAQTWAIGTNLKPFRPCEIRLIESFDDLEYYNIRRTAGYKRPYQWGWSIEFREVKSHGTALNAHWASKIGFIC